MWASSVTVSVAIPPISSSFAPDDRAGAAKERRVPGVVAALNEDVKERVFLRNRVREAEVALVGRGRIEVVRRLHERDLAVAEHPSHGVGEEGAHRNVVAVEDHDEFAVNFAERVVDVPRLGALVLFTADVADAGLFREGLKVVAVAVVENPDVELLFGPVHRLHAQNRRAHEFERLVVARNAHVDMRPEGTVLGERAGLAVEHPEGLEVAERHQDEGVDLRRHEKR